MASEETNFNYLDPSVLSRMETTRGGNPRGQKAHEDGARRYPLGYQPVRRMPTQGSNLQALTTQSREVYRSPNLNTNRYPFNTVTPSHIAPASMRAGGDMEIEEPGGSGYSRQIRVDPRSVNLDWRESRNQQSQQSYQFQTQTQSQHQTQTQNPHGLVRNRGYHRRTLTNQPPTPRRATIPGARRHSIIEQYRQRSVSPRMTMSRSRGNPLNLPVARPVTGTMSGLSGRDIGRNIGVSNKSAPGSGRGTVGLSSLPMSPTASQSGTMMPIDHSKERRVGVAFIPKTGNLNETPTTSNLRSPKRTSRLPSLKMPPSLPMPPALPMPSRSPRSVSEYRQGNAVVNPRVEREHEAEKKKKLQEVLRAVEAKPFACPVCNVRFSQLAALKEHVREGKHNAQGWKSSPFSLRPFVCSLCNKSFDNKYNLKRHLLIHTGEKAYRCEECGKRFTQRSGYTAHKKRMHSK